MAFALCLWSFELCAGVYHCRGIKFIGQENEGISSRMAQGYYTARTQTCIQVLDKLRNVGAIMLRSPPASGKTSLCQLIVDVARKSSAFESAYYVNCAAADSHTGFFGSWHRFNHGHPFEVASSSLASSPTHTDCGSDQQGQARLVKLIVVDEAHRTYNQDKHGCSELWSRVRECAAAKDARVVFLFAAPHGSDLSACTGTMAASPYTFGPDQTISLRWDMPT